MARSPSLSIITVVRNAAEPLRQTIESVRRQTYPRIEFIVVDGASSDGTLDVLSANASKVDRWISEPDKGLYDAMNKGKAMASGDFAMFVNAGDIFVDDDAIANMAVQVTDFDTLYFGKVRITDCTGALSWEVPVTGKRHTLSVSYLPHHQSIFYPRRFFTATDYDPDMGYRADAHYTDRACRQLHGEFTNITLIQTTLGGTSSRVITSIAELRREIVMETALARHIAATTGKRFPLMDVTASAIVKYLASKTGGLPLVHRLMYTKHVVRSWIGSISG